MNRVVVLYSGTSRTPETDISKTEVCETGFMAKLSLTSAFKTSPYTTKGPLVHLQWAYLVS